MMPAPTLTDGLEEQAYAGLAGDTGIRSYALVPGGILLTFTDGRRYRYDATRPGARDVRNMVRLARKGIGLTTYINRYVRERYAARLDG